MESVAIIVALLVIILLNVVLVIQLITEHLLLVNVLVMLNIMIMELQVVLPVCQFVQHALQLPLVQVVKVLLI